MESRVTQALYVGLEQLAELSCSPLPATCTDSPFREHADRMIGCLSVRLSVCLQVNEHLRDILVEEQKLRDNFHESNSTAQKVRHKLKLDKLECLLRMDDCFPL